MRDDFFQRVGDRKVDFIEDYMGPFFASVAENIRAINPDWILFAELDPMAGFFGPGFPADTPPNTVNAGHWYDIVTLATKTFSPNFSLDAMTGEIATAAERFPGALRTPARQIRPDVRDGEWRRADSRSANAESRLI